MKLNRSFLAANLIFTLVFISFLTLASQSVSAQDSKIALQRGYRTGYSDGYMSGYRDSIENAKKSYGRHSEYKNADRAYNSDYGKLSDYKDGYQQGFEKGYDTGFAKQSFDAAIPNDLSLRGLVEVKMPAKVTDNSVSSPETPVENNVAVFDDEDDEDVIDDAPVNSSQSTSANTDIAYKPAVTTSGPPASKAVLTSTIIDSPKPVLMPKTDPVASLASGDEIIVIPADTELIIELIDEIDTEKVREGDSFKARVSSPYEISGAIIEGRIARNRQPGRLKRRAELLLSFDRIKLSESRWANFNAIIVEVLAVKGDNVKRVDNEGTVAGQRPYKEDALKIGASTGAGVLIGAVVGGPVGAAVGAGVGAAFGVGAVVVERGKWIKLSEQQQLRIKTAYETQIR